jgi:tRNA-2-methylthio-N6-dimethylallyladenosine synthase
MSIRNYHIITFGCQANFSDSERIAGVLEKSGFKKANNENSADVLVFNTCSVRQSAEDRIFGLNKKLRKLKIKNSKLKIILAGCMNHYAEKELKKRLPYIDIFLPIKNLAQLSSLLKIKNKNSLPLGSDAIKNIQSACEYLSFAPKYESKFRAYVPISSGCNNSCSYCIVPYSRGKEHSRPAQEIIFEVKNLVKKGYKEIWLLGQNVNSYSSQYPTNSILAAESRILKAGKVNFPALLRIVNNIPGNFWLRFTSPHPKDFSDELIAAIAECEKITEYINLPVQSGDNKILQKMNRPYARGDYINLVNRIKKAIPNISISTDIIVGFPGETKRQFQNTVKLFKKIKFDMAYISEYSPRPGTLAARKFKDNVRHKEKIKRRKYLTEILAETALANNKKLLGKTLNVLIDEEKSPSSRSAGSVRPSRLFGRTRGNKVVEIDLNSEQNLVLGKPDSIRLSEKKIGKFVKVKIFKAEPWKIKGILV